jgi:uncharacterized membrane-anchored protein
MPIDPNKPQSKYINRTYRLTRDAVISIEQITDRLSLEAGIEIARGKVLELAILHIKFKSLQDLLNLK